MRRPPGRDPLGRAAKAGLAPGSVVYTGTFTAQRPVIELLRYDAEELVERPVPDAGQVPEAVAGQVTWLNVVGLSEPLLLEQLGAHFGLHPLTVEDVASVGQRPKLEVYERYLFLVLRMLRLADGRLQSEQLSMVLLPNLLITFQERPGDVFDAVRQRLRQGRGRIRRQGSDYLAYALIDVVVDSYFTLLEHYGDAIEALELGVFERPDPGQLRNVSALRRETLVLRRAVWPLRELLSALQREESPLLSATVHTHLRDVYDHTIQAIDTLETTRELLDAVQDAYVSLLSFRMSEVMRVLTVISTVFIPLTFLVGVYGMNFEFMPELRLWWAYPALWVLMVAVAASMLAFFKRRGWF